MPKLSPKQKRKIAKVKKDKYFVLFETVAINLALPMKTWKSKEESQELVLRNCYWMELINGMNSFMIDQTNSLNHHPSDLALLFTLSLVLSLFALHINTLLELPIKKTEFIQHVLPVQSYLAEHLSNDHLYLLDELIDLVLNVHNDVNGNVRQMDRNSYNYSHDFSCEFLDVFQQLYPSTIYISHN